MVDWANLKIAETIMKKEPDVVIIVEGGIVQEVFVKMISLKVAVLDYDEADDENVLYGFGQPFCKLDKEVFQHIMEQYNVETANT